MSAETNIAVVTGGAGGIGAEIARQLLEAGYEVVVLDRDKPKQTHAKLHAVTVDLLDQAAVKQAAAEVAGKFAVTHVVHNAGIIRPATIEDTKLDDLDALTQLHVGAALQLVQAVLPGMKQRGFGRIVLMSTRGALGLASRTAYGATKAGVIGMARSWALELAPAGITVNVVAPGPIGDTDMFRSVIPEGDPREQNLAQAIPVKRLGRSDDVARAVLFFADRRNSFITGQTLFVCGGASVGTLVI
jgi:NAD(P)-dependent dehydrogenase (short-subunit alcohol dehydrogenase family)